MRYVFVQPSAYGFDNSCMLDAMRELDPAIRRGIIDLDENKTGDKELADLNALGVRGIRVNISPIRKPEAGLAASMLPRIARLTKICQELGWALDDQLTIACGEGAVRLIKLQREGRAPLPTAEFLRGNPVTAGARLT